MKKLFSFFVPLMALLLTLSPQTAIGLTIDDYLQMPLTIEKDATSNVTVKVFRAGNNSDKNTSVTINLEYRVYKNNAWGSWQTICTTSSKVSALGSNYITAGTLNGIAGKIQLRGDNSANGFSKSASDYYQIDFTCGGSTRPSIYVYGNVMSLIYGYNTSNAAAEETSKATLAAANEIPCDYCFYRLFKTETANSLVYLYTENLIFPATKLTSHCYEDLFKGVYNGSYGLKSAPTFLATDFKDKDGNHVSSSFAGLCYGCSNLTNIHVNFKKCPEAGDNNLTNWMYNVNSKTIYAPAGFISNECGTTNLNGSWTKTEFSYTITTTHHIIFTDENDVTKYEQDVTEGEMPVYSGPSLEKEGYQFIWSPSLTAAMEDKTYKATYARLYTLTVNTGGNGTIKLEATDYADAENTATYKENTVVHMTVEPNAGYRFTGWSDGGSANPRDIIMNEVKNLTAEFVFDYTPISTAQSANIFQGATNDTTKILYVLASETVGGITYTPKDMGYGVAWSDKNVGASASTDVGSYFYWSGTAAVGTNDNANRYIGVESESEGYSLPPTKDPAQVNISSAWYMPTKAEWQDLIDNCTWTRQNQDPGSIHYDLNITNKTDNTKTIYLPYTGYKTGNNYGPSFGPTAVSPSGRYACYWLNTLYSSSASGILFEYAYSFQADGTNTNGAIIHSHLCYESMPVRPIYKPIFPTCKLTINVGSKSYVYVCELGQSITITAKPTVVGNGFLRWNEDGNTQATRTFVPQGDETYTAIFGELTTYAITFVDEDGSTVLDGPTDVIEGNLPVYNGSTPTKAATAQYTYTFNGWSPALYAADKVQTYTATYSSTLNQYTVTWKSEDGLNTLKTDADQDYGTGTAFNGSTPTKDATAQYTYTFDGWATEANGEKVYNINGTPTVSGNATYYAHFSAATNQYTLSWDFDGGSTVTNEANYTHGSVAWGTTIISPADPTKASDLVYSYTFAGWNDGTTTYAKNTALPAVTGNVTYTAVYNSADLTDFDLEDDKNDGNGYYGVLSQLEGKTRNVRYMRTFAANQWYVFSLPFSLNLFDSNNSFYGCVYTFDDVTYEADGTLSFNFVTNTMPTVANKPYIFYSNTGLSEYPVFNEVVFAKSEAYNGADSQKGITGGSVSFVNTTVRTKLTNLLAENKRLIYIYNNTLYYPQDGSNVWMRAFRGYFTLNNVDIRYVNPRVRIVKDGQTATEIETAVTTEDASARKFVKDGMLLIERNGVVYNAQGAVVR